MDKDHILRRLEHLSHEATVRNESWSAEFLFICEHLWAAAQDPQQFDVALNPNTIPAFTAMLPDNECLGLAQQIIPELRGIEKTTEPVPESRYRAAIFNAIRLKQTSSPQLFTPQVNPPQPIDLADEMDIFHDAELHRARLYLQRDERFSAEEQAEVVKWLEQCPGALRRLASEMGKRQEKHTENGKGKQKQKQNAARDSTSGRGRTI